MGQHGGKRPGAGRKPGSRNRATIEQRATLSDLAQAHTTDALRALVEVARDGSDSARVAAAVALLDRGYGKPTQMVVGPGDDGEHLHRLEADEAFARVAAALDGHAAMAQGGTDEAG